MEPEELTEEMLREMYHSRGMSLNEIADETGVFQVDVWKRMDKLGVETRSQEEARSTGSKWSEPGIKTHSDGFDYLVHNDGKETHRIRMDKVNALVDHSLDELQGKVLYHRNGVRFLSYPENIEVLTQEEMGKLYGSRAGSKKTLRQYATPQHLITDMITDERL